MAGPLTIMGIMVDDRGDQAPDIQKAITKYGTDIICRMGVPSPSKEKGCITLIMEADGEAVSGLRQELSKIKGTEVQTMSFLV